jgi:hypothetical protein
MKSAEILFKSRWFKLQVCSRCFEVADDYKTIPGPFGDLGYYGRSPRRNLKSPIRYGIFFDRPRGGRFWDPVEPCPRCGKISFEIKTVRIVYVRVPVRRKRLFWMIDDFVIDEYFEQVNDEGEVSVLPKVDIYD